MRFRNWPDKMCRCNAAIGLIQKMSLIEVEQAWDSIARQTSPLPTDELPVGASLAGRRLASRVLAQRDSPPFNKSMMDGFAVRAVDVHAGVAMPVAGSVFAGHAPPKRLEPGAAVRIMTGAELPAGADAVVVVEQSEVTQVDGDERVSFFTESLSGKRPGRGSDPDASRTGALVVKPGQNVMPAGRVWKAGTVLFEAGHRLRATDIGLLAEAGAGNVFVFRQPRVAVLATGDELIGPGVVPGSGQIVNSNGLMLEALAAAGTAGVHSLGIARDGREELRSRIREGLKADVLVLSGGVSAGQADLVPSVLAECGVRQAFHQVAVKPGKPVWYGTASVEGRTVHVFGLPGNPVSSLVCFELFVRPAILRLGGSPDLRPNLLAGVLAVSHEARGVRPTWWPVKVSVTGPAATVQLQPLEWLGSSDQRPLASADGLACFPPIGRVHEAGSVLRWLPLNFF